ncbi:MAG TPA: archaemetzincin family Zn-dependent metalloprotease [Bacteroidota bacterium]|nr:archaemetzincin family Zn-dependent metalloprotease [Bacteroidota bacterium]
MSSSIHILGGSSLVHPQELEGMAENISAIFGLRAIPSRIEPDLRAAYDPSRGQYNSTILLSGFLERAPAGPDKHIILVDVDLFIPVLTFVFGEAQFDGTAAIVSTHRLSNQFYGLPGSHELLLLRLEKELIHELGHTFGLYHCRQFECVMRSSTYVEEIDIKKALPCPDCAARIHGISGRNN